MSINGTPQPANQNELDELAGRLQSYARAHFVGVYTGLELRSEQDRVRVYRKPSAEFDAWVVQEFARDCVEVADARYSEMELLAVFNRVTGDLQYWQSKGVPVSTVSVNPDGSGIEVRSTDVERTKRELAQRYGTEAPITVVYGEPPVAGPGFASR